jgi:hypothetical protein
MGGYGCKSAALGGCGWPWATGWVFGEKITSDEVILSTMMSCPFLPPKRRKFTR